MTLDRGKLAKIDRRVFAELDHGERSQMVKVPLSDAAWATWRRYCDVLCLTMGEGIAGLIDSELAAVVDGGADGDSLVFAVRAGEQLAAREAQVAAREHAVKATQERLRAWGERLRRREGELEWRGVRAEESSKSTVRRQDAILEVGRNDRCPCGSGLTYKQCHGRPGG